MLKNIQVKLIIIFTIVGIVCLLMCGVYQIYNIEQIGNIVADQNIQKLLSEINNRSIISIIFTVTGLLILAVIVIYYITNTIVKSEIKMIKAAKQLIAKEEIRMDSLIETILLKMSDGVIAFDKKGNLLYINNAAKEMFELEQLVDNFEQLLKKIKLDINLEKIIYLDTWTSYDQRINIGEKHLSLMFVPFKDDVNISDGVILVVQDITEHVNLDKMKTEFVENVSHELKTPITSVIGYAETIKDMGMEDKDLFEKFLNVIISEANRMSVLVSDLLVLFKHGVREDSEKEQFDLGEVVKSVTDKLLLEANKKEQTLESFVTAKIPSVYGDKFGIERVIINVITNSIKYTKEKGIIKVYAGCVYNYAYIKIIDTGIGIPEKDLERIFERFYRVDKDRSRESGGTGLGLAIAKEILEHNDATIEVKSEIDKGTEIVIKMPINQERNSNDGK